MRALVPLLLISSGVARAQAIAVDPPPPPPPPPHSESGGDVAIGGRLAFGFATTANQSTAWVARFEEEFLSYAPRANVGPLAGISFGYDYWRAGHGTWGMSVPAQANLGFRAYGVRVMAGVGANVIVLDQVHGDTGFGLYAPLASLSAGLDVRGFTLLADARVSRRWQFGADDFTQWMFTLSIGYTDQGGAAVR